MTIIAQLRYFDQRSIKRDVPLDAVSVERRWRRTRGRL